jgi:hypothetical protein
MVGVPPVEHLTRVRCWVAEAGKYLSGQDPLTWTDWGRAKSQHASQQSRPAVSRGVPSHFAALRRMRIYQDKCDEMGFSATLRHNPNRTTDQKVAGSNPAERAEL